MPRFVEMNSSLRVVFGATLVVLVQTVMVSAWTSPRLRFWKRKPARFAPTLRQRQMLAASFDFSSPSEWDTFYLENNNDDEDDGNSSSSFDWHSSIDLDTIASFVPPNADCLMIGCGNSRLPGTVLSKCENPHNIVLLDTSKTCLDQLKLVYESAVEYQCGDASKLDDIWDAPSFDIIIDKGLTDAVLCGEGWDWILDRVLQGASHVLRRGSGQYLLISYKLSKSTKEFLKEVGDRVGLDWKFDLPQSNERVSVSLATRVRNDSFPHMEK